MKKRIITIMVAGLLLAWGLGSFALAQEEPVNLVDAAFETNWIYTVPGDSFASGEVTGRAEWHTVIWNEPDDTGSPVSALEASLNSDLVFDSIEEKNLVTMGPPTYEWSFGDVPESSEVDPGVRFWSPDPFPVVFNPGLDASRSVDTDEFTGSDPQTQTLDIEVTPQQEIDDLSIHVRADEDELVNPVILSVEPISDEEVRLSPDGHNLDIDIPNHIEGHTYAYEVTIQVTLKVASLEFMPDVHMYACEDLNSGTATGNTISGPAYRPDLESTIGNWTCSADGTYTWHWRDVLRRRLAFPHYSGNHVQVSFNTWAPYQVTGDVFNNQEVTGTTNWNAHMRNDDDESGAPVSALNLSFDSELEFEWVNPEPVTMGPPTYEWSYGDVPQGSEAHANLGSEIPVTFTPGFDASRSADITQFSEPDTQTVTITVTPRDTTENFSINVRAWEDELVDPVITSPATDEEQGIWLDPDGHGLDIHLPSLDIGTTYTYCVTIDVIPKLPTVEFMPQVNVWRSEVLDSGNTAGSYISYQVQDPADPAVELGTWTWSADGTYVWHWEEVLERVVEFPRYRGNHVGVGFNNVTGVYTVPGDSFTNHEVTGSAEWGVPITNDPDGTGASVTELTVTLDSPLEFDRVEYEESLTQMGPPTYEWSFGDLAQGDFVGIGMRFVTPEPFPVTFIPGFDASRTLSQTEFLQSNGTQTQTLTITVTPREPQVVTEGYWIVVVGADDQYRAPDEYDLVDAVIPSAELVPGHILLLSPTGLELNAPWTTTVEIEVTPKVPQVEFAPCVQIFWFEPIPGGTTVGSSVSHTLEQMGTWTVSAEGNYVWHWNENVGRAVEWESSCRDLNNHVGVGFITNVIYTVPGDSFINDEVTGSMEWGLPVINDADETGEPVTGLTVTLDSQLEFDRTGDLPPVTMGPPTYEWSFDDLAQDDWVGIGVRFLTPDPFPVTFTPGFNASRSLSQTEFSGPGIQTVTVTLMPQEVLTSGYWLVLVAADDQYKAPDEYDLVDAVITSPGAVYDGYMLIMSPPLLEPGDTWTTTVEIQVTPKVPRVEFAPCVQIFWIESIPGGTTVGSSISHTIEQMGTWTVSAEGDYVWHWSESYGRAVEFESFYGEGIEDFAVEHMFVDFDRRPKLDEIVGEATFYLQEGATYDLDTDDVTVSIDGVDITIPAGSFVPGKGGDYIFKSPRGVEPKVNMKLNFDKGEWSFKVDKIDAGIVDHLDGVDVAFCIGYMAAKERINMRIGGLSYIAEQ